MAIQLSANSGIYQNASPIDFNSAYTVMGWFFVPGSLSPVQTLFTIVESGGNAFDSIYIAGTYLVQEIARYPVAGSSANDSAISTGWQHVAFVRESVSVTRTVVNGSTGSNLTLDVTGRDTAGTLQNIGHFLNFSGFYHSFQSPFCHIYIYNAALTNAEIADQMYCAYPRRTNNLREWLPLDRASTRDFSGNGRSYTEFGTGSDADGLMLARPPLIFPKQGIVTPNASPLMLLACF